ncbi:GyrI-like domain-containing protein [Demequina pelophila]|uniref:GyrI-like domain-containing protein n=1 Tax=Demequina pelophila TaxID=1638984 RepID=UPI00078166BF|nr:GyrI-like domain-containing protein [Demequina pelophila]
MTLQDPQVVDLPEQHVAVVSGVVPMAELGGFFGKAFAAVWAATQKQGVEPAEAPFARYRGMPADVCDLDVGMAVATPIEVDGDVHPSTLPAGRAVTAIHAGAYDAVGESWGRLMAWTADQGLAPAGPFWEVYLNEPVPGMDPADLRTQLVIPVEG